MKRIFVVLATLSLLAGAVCADDITISVARRSGEKEKSNYQDLPHSRTRVVREEKYYEISLRRMNPNAPEQVDVEWFVFIERPNGRTVLGRRGRAAVALPIGREVAVMTEDVTLVEREWSGDRSGDIGTDLKGYGVRVLGPDGALLAEKFSEESLKALTDTPVRRSRIRGR